jgi:hypothetical protein
VFHPRSKNTGFSELYLAFCGDERVITINTQGGVLTQHDLDPHEKIQAEIAK